ncbi:Calmodulin-like protein 3 [Varanus komodoensis]|uniref:EF-hand domain-containing protein n=1 Tax=Varanus komodoensis TaxID=61221 RepID=A0A8D2IP69_VARKO|nr:Calmodulin-like protein 3 [Varanus komodoensis]
MAHRFSEAELGVFKEAFSHFDTDGDGKVTAEELGSALRSLVPVLGNLQEAFTEEKVEQMVRQVDKDGDGKISFEEFVKMLEEK